MRCSRQARKGSPLENPTLSRGAFLAIVEAGVRAPSADNRLPFSFDQTDGSIRIWGNEEFVAASLHRKVLSLLSLGAVVENMDLRAKTLGFQGTPNLFPDPGQRSLAVELKLSPRTPLDIDLAAAIPRRHTNRRFFHGPPLAEAERLQIESDAHAVADVRLLWFPRGRERTRLLRLIRIAETERFLRRDLHHELFSCVRFDAGWHASVEEGLAPGSLEVEAPLRGIFRALRSWRLMKALHYVGLHHVLGLRSGYAPCLLSPHLAVITTTLELEPGAFAVGRALERLWLRASALDVSIQPLAASALFGLADHPAVRPAITRTLVAGWAELTGNRRPLMVLRLGRSAPVTVRSQRRPVDHYLRKEKASGATPRPWGSATSAA